MNHGDLCQQAVKWLRRPESQGGPGCNVAVSECTGSYSGEIADAIGFRSVGEERYSIVVEVKISKADFRADASKPHRSGVEVGMGKFRYFLAPSGVLKLEDLPAGWGLIESCGRALKVVAGHVLEERRADLGWKKNFSAWEHIHNGDRETALLVRLLARLDAEGMQRQLKVARSRLQRANQLAESHRVELERALNQYWDLRRQLDEAVGGVQPVAIPRQVLKR